MLNSCDNRYDSIHTKYHILGKYWPQTGDLTIYHMIKKPISFPVRTHGQMGAIFSKGHF